MRSYFCSFPLTLLALILFCSFAIVAVAADGPVPALNGIPGPLQWQHAPAEWHIEQGRSLVITAGKQTDWFSSPFDGSDRPDNSPRLLFFPAEDFALSAKVTVDFATQWDGGCLVLYQNDQTWAKLCVEKTIEQHPAIVSVVTRRLSDDCNSVAVEGRSVYLKIAKAGSAIFFYSSADGERWTIIRAFNLGATPGMHAGFTSQSPLGDHCTTHFEQMEYLPKRINLWSGK